MQTRACEPESAVASLKARPPAGTSIEDATKGYEQQVDKLKQDVQLADARAVAADRKMPEIHDQHLKQHAYINGELKEKEANILNSGTLVRSAEDQGRLMTTDLDAKARDSLQLKTQLYLVC